MKYKTDILFVVERTLEDGRVINRQFRHQQEFEAPDMLTAASSALTDVSELYLESRWFQGHLPLEDMTEFSVDRIDPLKVEII